MKKKAQMGPIGYIFSLIIFLIFWFLFLGSWLNTWGQKFIEAAELNGWEAFVMANLNMVVFIFLILGTIGYFYFMRSA